MSRQYATSPPEEHQDSQFIRQRYRAVNKLAVTSLAFGVLSILTIVDWMAAMLPVTGILLALLALYQINRRPEEQTGKGFAWAGLGASVFLWMLGYGWLTHSYFADIPPGYQPISFAQLKPDPDQKGSILPDDIVDELHDKRVFLKGYMYPGRRSMGITQFILVPTRGHCKFCSRTLKSTEMVQVKLDGDHVANYQTQLTRVGGVFKVDEREAANPLGGLPYTIEADYIR